MLFRLKHIDLSRRVAGYFVLFCAASLTWVAISTLIALCFASRSQIEEHWLAQLDNASSVIVLDYARHGDVNLQSLVERIQSENGAKHCAVVSIDGEILAHSSNRLVGETYSEPAAEHSHQGETERLRFRAADSDVMLVEYRTPLRKGEQKLGMLHMAVSEPVFWDTISSAVAYSPIVVLGPLLCILFGTLVLGWTVRPVSAIVQQLGRLTVAVSPAQVQLQEVRDSGPAAFGWNRLVEVFQRSEQHRILEQRVEQGLSTLVGKQGHDILNSLPDGLAITNQEGHITFANQAFTAICGSGNGNGGLDGKTMEHCLTFTEKQDSAAAFLEPGARGRSVVAEVEQSTNGSPQVLRVARYPLRRRDGQSGGAHVWSVRDVTQQKLAGQMRDQFLQTASHELRTPLANIKAYAETLGVGSDELDVEQQKEFCNTINSEASRLARLVDDLLSVSSMEAGSLSLTRQETDVGRLLEEVIGKVKAQMDGKGVTFENVFPAKWPKLHLDKDMIATSLINMLGNAVKYTPPGGNVALRVMADQSNLTIAVEDTGVGISPEELPRVFNKFFRSVDPRVQQESGSGLGLCLVKEVVHMHGGTVDVKSELNAGTRFTITLPIR